MSDTASDSPVFDRYAALLRAEEPVALVTVIDGTTDDIEVGAKLLVTTDGAEPLA